MTRTEARKRAPRHPPAPEAKIRAAIIAVMQSFHKELARRAAKRFLSGAKRHDAVDGDDLDDQLDDLDDDAEPEKKSGWLGLLFFELWAGFKASVDSDSFRNKLTSAASATAKSARDQTAKTLGLPKSFQPDLADASDTLVEDSYSSTVDNAGDSMDRVQDILDDIDVDDPEYSDLDEQDIENDVTQKLEDGLDSIMGKALMGAALAFGVAFADMILNSQNEAGVSQYVWISMSDDRVRPAHFDLDGQTCDWDNPPLTADVSSNGEDDHPGEDYNCRCVASPIEPDEGYEEES